MNVYNSILTLTHIIAFLLGSSFMYYLKYPTYSLPSTKEQPIANTLTSEVKCNLKTNISAQNINYTEIIDIKTTKNLHNKNELKESSEQENETSPIDFISNTGNMLINMAKYDTYYALSWLFSNDKDAMRFKTEYPLNRMETIRKIVIDLPEHQLPMVLDTLRNNHDDGLLISALCAAVSGNQPKLNRLWVLDSLDWYATDDAMGKQLKNALLTEWTASDAQSAQTWAIQHEQADQKDSTILSIASELVNSDPIAAIQFANNYLSESIRSREFEYLISAWIDKDPQAVATWLIEQYPSPDINNALNIFKEKIGYINFY